ncbi:unnamed protein product [Amoebophrya sp. A120]|nr:unnamed protein product [Amoebophrya sp. A120]|eukprot:GSA120T00019921001.1
MKIKVLHHAAEGDQGKANEMTKIQRNPDPILHPFAREREYQRALNSVKIEKMFEQPFVKALDNHFDAVRVIKRSNVSATRLYSGACDGEILLWDLGYSKVQSRWKAHTGFVRGIIEEPNLNSMNSIFTCGDDKCIHWWDLNQLNGSNLENEAEATSSAFASKQHALNTSNYNVDKTSANQILPKHTYRTTSPITSIDHHWSKPMLISTGETVDVWDRNRSQPVSSIEWGCEQVFTAKFNPAEPCLIAATAADNSISLYDLRQSTQQGAIRKVLLKNRSNALCWNPQEPTHFTAANENGHLYSFDMRKLTHALTVHQDHQMPVLDIDFAPNGQEFVSASYDKTIRVWSRDGQKSKHCYHTKRMQRVLTCQFSTDGRFVFSGSEDHNVRIWKANASEKLGTVSEREKKSIYYKQKLVEKFSACREISKIKKFQRLPKQMKNNMEKQKIMKDAKKRKDENRRAHSAVGSVPFESERNKFVRGELE